ncbi:MAG: type I-B CRISPR-associated protein Cas7/Cst2/DevR [Candidatus Anstonellaceae archaeon]
MNKQQEDQKMKNQKEEFNGHNHPQINKEPSKYIVLDILFYGSSLNYDQGSQNYQELKKITKWDGKQYVMVSRYALRYSILHWANKMFPDKWKLMGKEQFEEGEENKKNKGPPKLKLTENKESEEGEENKKNKGQQKITMEILKQYFEDFPEIDLFGFMVASENQTITRTSPVKISHAISLTPYNYDSHFSANLDIVKRAYGPNKGSNPINIEEKLDFYLYNVVIDVNRVGLCTKEEIGYKEKESPNNNQNNNQNQNQKIDIGEKKRKERILQLIKAIFSLKREIKGRMEDLIPWLAIVGLYNDAKYQTYLNRIELEKNQIYKTIRKEKEFKDSEGRTVIEVENQIIEKEAPKFLIHDDLENKEILEKEEEMFNKIGEFIGNDKKGEPANQILIYKKSNVKVEFGEKNF